MAAHPGAGKPAPRDTLINVPRLVSAFYALHPDPGEPAHRVEFGTSGHRGSALTCSFNERHILAMTQAIVEHRKAAGVQGPLHLGMDTHALSEPALITALEVLAAHQVHVRVDAGRGYTPTPVISHAILCHNRQGRGGQADGIVITPSHNPPADGGFKYNPPHGGPASGAVTTGIEARANELLREGTERVPRMPLARALAAGSTERYDYVTPYVADLASVLDMDAIAVAGLRIGADPMGGAGIAYWEPIAERYGLQLEVVNAVVDPTFAFMPLDKDGVIRMDCSSPHAMAGLVGLSKSYDIAFGNDTDFDRHGIVTPTGGLLNPNHYLAVAIDYLFGSGADAPRPQWSASVAIGKTLVSSAMIDRVGAFLGRRVEEVPVGFKWFVEGLHDGRYGFAGEESAGASTLRRDGTVWTTDKDGILLALLAAEITARTGRDPAERYRALTERHGEPIYERLQAPASAAERQVLSRLTPAAVTATELAGEPIEQKLTTAPGNGAAIGGLKVVTANGWFAARPSGTEPIYKIYTESFAGPEHLHRIQEEAQAIVAAALAAAR